MRGPKELLAFWWQNIDSIVRILWAKRLNIDLMSEPLENF